MSKANIQIPLDLPNMTVLSVEVGQGGYVISVESTVEGTQCQRCGRSSRAMHGYNDWVEVRHLPILDRSVIIRYRPKRYGCPYCEGKPTTTQAVSWHTTGSGMTTAYERYLLKALIHGTVQDVSQKEQISYDSVLGVMERCVASEVKWATFKQLGVLGIDEIAVKKRGSVITLSSLPIGTAVAS